MSAETLVNNQPFVLSSSQQRFLATISKRKDYQVWLMAGGEYYPTSLNSQTITVRY